MKQKGLILNERIDLALGHLVGGLDRRPIVKGTGLEGLPYTMSYMGRHLVMMHSYPETMETPGRYLTALALCLKKNSTFRCGKISGMDAAEHLAAYINNKISEEGKFVTTKEELDKIQGNNQIFAEPLRPDGDSEELKANWYGQPGRVYDGQVSICMEGLVRWYLLTGDKKAKAAIDRAIRGKISDPKDPVIAAGKGTVVPGLMTSLSMYYEATGEEHAKKYLEELATDFIHRVYRQYFPDGRHAHGNAVGHLHIRLGAVAALARYAQVSGREEYLSAVEDLLTTNTQWGTEFGYMPERHVFAERGSSDTGHVYQPWVLASGKTVDFSWFTRPRSGWDTCEICVTADAIDAAILLARSGREKYWDVAERYLNQLFAAQITDTSYLLDEAKNHHEELIGATFQNVREILTGGFLSFSTPTRALAREQYGQELSGGREGVCEKDYYGVSVACCHGWGARTLGRVYESIVTQEQNQVEVNFPFDIKTSTVEVKSNIPGEGKIEIKALSPVDVYVRIPDWVEHDRVQVRVNGCERKVELKNAFSDYVQVGRLNAGDQADLRYPLRKETKRYFIDYHPCLYEAQWLGNYVTNMKEIKIETLEGDNSLEGIGQLYSDEHPL